MNPPDDPDEQEFLRILLNGLTKQEVLALFLVVEYGATDKEIAELFHIKSKSAGNYVSALLAKFHVPNRAKLIVVMHRAFPLYFSGDSPL